MNNINVKPLHHRLLIASYVVGAVATLLGTLAAIGATLERHGPQYPPLRDSEEPPSWQTPDLVERHFGLRS